MVYVSTTEECKEFDFLMGITHFLRVMDCNAPCAVQSDLENGGIMLLVCVSRSFDVRSYTMEYVSVSSLSHVVPRLCGTLFVFVTASVDG